MRRPLNLLSLLVMALSVSGAVAQEPQEGTGTPKPATPSYNKGPDFGRVNHNVTVAKVSHKFDPEYINATIGDTITFIFYPKTHSATLTDFKSPCVPWSSEHIGQEDTWSGLITEDKPRIDAQTWTWRVDTNDPRFWYCSGKGSCAGWGMVFAVNPTPEQSWENFQARAKTASYQMSPGQSAPDESGDTDTNTTTTTGHKGLSTGAIVGIVIGAIGAVALVGLLFFLIGRSRRKSASEKAAAAAAAAAPLAQTHVDAGPVQGVYGDHPPEYYGQPGPVWDGKGMAPPAPPLSPVPSQFNPHASMYGSPPPTNPHASWAPSELGGDNTVQPQRVEIYTPGVDERIPLNKPPTSA